MLTILCFCWIDTPNHRVIFDDEDDETPTTVVGSPHSLFIRDLENLYSAAWDVAIEQHPELKELIQSARALVCKLDYGKIMLPGIRRPGSTTTQHYRYPNLSFANYGKEVPVVVMEVVRSEREFSLQMAGREYIQGTHGAIRTAVLFKLATRGQDKSGYVQLYSRRMVTTASSAPYATQGSSSSYPPGSEIVEVVEGDPRGSVTITTYVQAPC